MKKWIIAVLCCISITSFAEKKPVQGFKPPTFKVDMENFIEDLNTMFLHLSNARTTQDSITAVNEIISTRNVFVSKWDVSAEMAKTTNSFVGYVQCLAQCASNMANCSPISIWVQVPSTLNPEQLVSLQLFPCFAQWGSCTTNCSGPIWH